MLGRRVVRILSLLQLAVAGSFGLLRRMLPTAVLTTAVPQLLLVAVHVVSLAMRLQRMRLQNLVMLALAVPIPLPMSFALHTKWFTHCCAYRCAYCCVYCCVFGCAYCCVFGCVFGSQHSRQSSTSRHQQQPASEPYLLGFSE